MRTRTAAGAVGLGLAAVVSVGGIAVAGGGDDGAVDVSSQQAKKAAAAALKVTPGGTTNSIERDGENGATWEVEVTKTDGSTVDVRLAQDYSLVVVEGDGAE